MSAASMGDVVKVIGKPELGTGVVRFHGKVKNNPATWIGLEFSRPLGKNNGSSNGVVYFSCPDNHGLFVKEDAVQVVKRAPKSDSVTPASGGADKTKKAPKDTKKEPKPKQAKKPAPAPAEAAAPSAPTPVAPATASAAATTSVPSDLTRQLHLLQTQVEELELEKEELMLDKEDADAKLEALDDLKAKLEEMSLVKERIAAVEGALKESKAENIKLQQKVQEASVAAVASSPAPVAAARASEDSEALSALQADNSKLRAMVEQSEESGKSMMEQSEAMEKELAEKEAEAVEMQKHLDEQTSEVAKVMASASTATQEKEALQKALDEAVKEKEAKVAELTAAAQGNSSQLADLLKQKGVEVEAAKKALEEALAQSTAQTAQLNEALEAEKAARKEESGKSGKALDEKLAEKDSAIAELVNATNESNAKASKAELAVQEAERLRAEQSAAWEAEKTRFVQEAQSAVQQVASLRAAAESQAGSKEKELMSTFQKEEERLKAQVQEALAAADKTAKELSQARSQLEEASAAHKVSSAEVEQRAKSEYQKVVDQAAAEKENLGSELIKVKAEAASQLEQSNKAHEAAMSKMMKELSDKCASLESALETSKQELASATEASKQLEANLTTLRSETDAKIASLEKARADAEATCEAEKQVAAAKMAELAKGSEKGAQKASAALDKAKDALQKQVLAKQAELEASQKHTESVKAESAKSLEEVKQGYAKQMEKFASNAKSGQAELQAALQKELEVSNAQVAALKASSEKAKLELAAEKAKSSTLSADATALEAKIAQAEERVAAIQTELVSTKEAWDAEKVEIQAKDAARVASAEETVQKNKATRAELQKQKDEIAKARDEARTALKVTKEEHAKDLEHAKKSAQEALEKVKTEQAEEQGSEELKEALEMATLDREIMEEKVEDLETELGKQKTELDELRAERNARAEAAQNVDAASLPEGARLVQEHNAKLVAAVQQLKQILDQQTAKSAEEIEMLKQENELMPLLEESVSALEAETAELKEQVQELKDALDERSGLDEMVEALSDEKMTLQDQLLAAESALLDMEELHELSKELEENQRAEEQKLRQALRTKETHILNLQGRIHNMQTQGAEAAATITKFRSQIAALSGEIETMRQREVHLSKREQELEQSAQTLRQHNIKLQASVDTDRSFALDAALAEIKSKQAETRLKLTLSLLPDGFFRSDMDAIVLLLACERLEAEAKLLGVEMGPLANEEPYVGLVMSGLLDGLRYSCSAIAIALEQGDQDHVETSACIPLVRSAQTCLSSLLEAVSTGKLTPVTPLDDLKLSVGRLGQFVIELHPDAPKPSAKIMVDHHLSSAVRFCAKLELLLPEEASVRLRDRLTTASVAATATLQHLARDEPSQYPASLREGMEAGLIIGSKLLESFESMAQARQGTDGADVSADDLMTTLGAALETNFGQSFEPDEDELAFVDEQLVLFVAAVNRLHDDVLTGGFGSSKGKTAPGSLLVQSGWQTRVNHVRDEISSLLEMRERIEKMEATLEASQELQEEKLVEIVELQRQIGVFNKKLSNGVRKEEVLRNQISLKDSELEQLRLMEQALATTQKELMKLEQERRTVAPSPLESAAIPAANVQSSVAPSSGAGTVSVDALDRHVQRYKNAVEFLSRRVALLEGRQMEERIKQLPELPVSFSPAKVPQMALDARHELTALRSKLRSRAALARVVDLSSEDAGKNAFLDFDIGRENAKLATQVAAKSKDVLEKLGGNAVPEWAAHGGGGQLVARIRVNGGGDDVVRLAAPYEDIKSLLR